MIEELLRKTRTINKLLQKSAGQSVNFQEVATVLSDNIDCSVYIIDNKGKVLGHNYLRDFLCEIMQEIVDSPAGFPKEYYENLVHVNETYSNVCQKGNACVFSFTDPCKFSNKVTTIIPILGAGIRLGTLVLAKFGQNFTSEDLILAEYGATVVGMEILRARADRLEEIARKRASVQVAIATLSYSELDAIRHIFKELEGEEGLLVASKIADRVGITRSVIVNALRKFESAGVIESKSLGMKGTYIRVLNDRLLEELERMKQN